MNKDPDKGSRWLTIFSEYFGLNRALSLLAVCFIGGVTCFAIFWFIRSAPPRTLTISSGPAGSTFERNAERYRTILASNGVTLKILPSQGSLENLKRLEDPAAGVDIAFVQGGVTDGTNTQNLLTLGSVAYEPLLVFYRGTAPVKMLSQLEGKRLAVGAEGSGTRELALALLKANGIEPGGGTQLLDLEGEPARKALLAQQADAIFLTGDSTGPATVREMLHEPGIRLYDFGQGDAYVRRFRYLNKLQIPAGAFDLGDNLPAAQVTMLAPTVELLAHSDLHPALSDLLIETAREVHGKATLLQNPGEFPAPLQHDYPISDDAARYYKSGKSTAYRYLPFWLASLVNRAAVVLVPIVVVLIPGLRIVPQLYGWRINNRINKRYGELMALERASLEPMTPEQRAALVEIEKSIIGVKMPSSYANQIYILRRHIKFVRGQLAPQGAALEHEPPGDEVGLILD